MKLHDWTKTIISPSDTIEMVIKVLDEVGMRIALVVDESGKLQGTITDGDVRRALLRKLGMSALVTEIMQKTPTTAAVTDDYDTVLSMMRRNDVLQIPILNLEGCVVGLETLQKLIDGIKYENPVFLMAGGFGTRLYPLTREKPKPLLRVGSKPILESILNQFIKSGFKNFYISTHYKAEMVREYFGDGSAWGVNIAYVHENKPLGTAGALGLLPKEMPKLPILMMNGDLVTNVNFENLLEFHYEQKGLATMCVREYDIQVPYGVVEMNEHRITSIIEKPLHKFFVNAGIYVLEPELVQQVSAHGYLDMPTLLEKQIEDGEQINSFPVHENWIDIGRIEEYERAKREAID